MNTSNVFSIALKVRDYECDMQGIVNNAVYMNYFEHARHEFLIQQGVNFKQLIDKDVFLIAVKSEIEFKKPLQAQTSFIVTCEFKQKSKVRVVFEQQILNKNNEIMTIGRMESAAINGAGKDLRLNAIFDLS